MLSRPSPYITRKRLRETANTTSDKTQPIIANPRTHIINPDEYASSGITSAPCSSRALRISSVASTEATAIHIASYAMKRPGHMRRPKPKAATSGSRTVGSSSSSPASFVRRKRSGLNVSGSVYTSGSCRIALRRTTIVRDQFLVEEWIAPTRYLRGRKSPWV